jgi:hypothetical protein
MVFGPSRRPDNAVASKRSRSRTFGSVRRPTRSRPVQPACSDDLRDLRATASVRLGEGFSERPSGLEGETERRRKRRRPARTFGFELGRTRHQALEQRSSDRRTEAAAKAQDAASNLPASAGGASRLRPRELFGFGRVTASRRLRRGLGLWISSEISSFFPRERHRSVTFGSRAGPACTFGSRRRERHGRKAAPDPTEHVVPERLRPRRLPAKPEGWPEPERVEAVGRRSLQGTRPGARSLRAGL